MMPKSILQTARPEAKQHSMPLENGGWRPEEQSLNPPPSAALADRRPESQVTTLFLSGMVVLTAWQLLVVLFEIPAWLLPGPADVVRRFMHVWADGSLVQHVVPTLLEALGGFGIALLVGSSLGYVVAHSRTLERWLMPYLAAIQAIPVIAVAPLIIIWLGYSSDLIRNILVAAIVVVFPIFSSTVSGVRGVPRELREVGLVEGATCWERLRYIELPLALPVLFSGFRTSLAYATTGAVVGEFIGSRFGLGALINVARGFFDTPLIFVAVACLGLITLLFGSVVLVLERLLTSWQEP